MQAWKMVKYGILKRTFVKINATETVGKRRFIVFKSIRTQKTSRSSDQEVFKLNKSTYTKCKSKSMQTHSGIMPMNRNVQSNRASED